MSRKDKIKESEYQDCTDFIKAVALSNSLSRLIDIHKQAWKAGIRTDGLKPDRYGMFRCDDITNMIEDEVYLGNIHGLFTLSVREWNKRMNDDPGSYNLVCAQYRNHLISNFKLYRSRVYDNGIDRERLCDVLAERLGVAKCVIKSCSLLPMKVHDLKYYYGGKFTLTKLFWFKDKGKDRFLVPDGCIKGENPSTVKEVRNTIWKDMNDGKSFQLKHSLLKGIYLEETVISKKNNFTIK